MNGNELPIGVIVGWRVGDVNPWATITVRHGAFETAVAVTSQQAREFAIGVLANQGPYLGYQPPNDQMREQPRVAPFGGGRLGKEPHWRTAGRVNDCAEAISEALSKIREQYGDEAFGWALGRFEVDATVSGEPSPSR